MTVKVVLVASDPTRRDRLAHVLSEASTVELVQSVGDLHGVSVALENEPELGVVIVDADLDQGNGHGVARSVSAAWPLLGLVMLVDQAGRAEFGAAMDVGARSVIAVSSSLDEIVSRLESVAGWSRAARESVGAELSGGRSGRVVAVAGAKGGVGTSVIALLLAQASVGVRNVTVVDFDLGSGDLAAYAGVRTRRSVVDLVDLASEVTGRVLRETSYELEPGLRLLPAPNDGEQSEAMTAAAARSIVAALRFDSDLAVIDLGDHLDEARATVLEYADSVLLVTTPDLPSLRATRRALQQWERLSVRAPARVDVVLNRRTSKDEVTRQVAERIIEHPLAQTVPDGGTAFESAMNTATVLETATPVRNALAGFVTREAERAAPAPVAAADSPEQIVASSRSQRRGRRRGRQPADSGQASVELPVVIALGLVLVLLCAQAIAWAGGVMVARSAAQGGARTVGIAQYYDHTVVQAARTEALDGMPGIWRDQAQVDVGPRSVSVVVRTPTIIPGLHLSSSADAAVYRERG
ncbi:MAG: hypothetical protein ACTMIR_16210 [Cellulomonadaceae bacterium]